MKLISHETYFSENYPSTLFPSFLERSSKVMFDFIERIVVLVRLNPSIKCVYFHNFSRFDGILLLKYLSKQDDKKYRFKPLMRNHKLYELALYHNKKLLFRIRDSLTLLPGSLDKLAENLCPEIGKKGSIPHEELNESNLSDFRDELISYLKMDILLLGGVMLKAQSIAFEDYKVDIVNKFTISSLSLTIFRTNYYDPTTNRIYMPNSNEDTFIRRGYYGGHADSYIPKGCNLYFYDVNSLYPYIMNKFPMPFGKPVWLSNLENEDVDLDSLFGFFEAYIVCPETINRPPIEIQRLKLYSSLPGNSWVSILAKN